MIKVAVVHEEVLDPMSVIYMVIEACRCNEVTDEKGNIDIKAVMFDLSHYTVGEYVSRREWDHAFEDSIMEFLEAHCMDDWFTDIVRACGEVNKVINKHCGFSDYASIVISRAKVDWLKAVKAIDCYYGD